MTTHAERLAAAGKADKTAERIAAMPRSERRKLVEHFERTQAESAPTLAAAGSDELAVLLAAAAEFAAKYYPEAERGSLMLTLPDDRHVMLPIRVG